MLEIIFTNNAGNTVILDDLDYPNEYETTGELDLLQWPPGMRVTIPGSDAVASFTQEPIPDVTPIPSASVSLSAFDFALPLAWEAGNSNNSRIQFIYGTKIDDAGIQSEVEVSCILQDDGEYSFPTEIRSYLEDTQPDSVEVFRVASRRVIKETLCSI